MMLLIDAGNSLVKWAYASANQAVTLEGCCCSKVNDLSQVLENEWHDTPRPGRILVANVAGKKVAEAICLATENLWQTKPEFPLSEEEFCGLTNTYDQPGRLGIDRLLAMLAAYREVRGPVIVIDCGTAVTVDLVSNHGVFLGGSIMPGLHLACQSLISGTDAIENCPGNAEINSVARTTDEAVTAGVLLGLVGGIEKVVADQIAHIDAQADVIITGGDAKRLLDNFSIDVRHRPDLVLEGLSLYAASHQK